MFSFARITSRLLSRFTPSLQLRRPRGGSRSRPRTRLFLEWLEDRRVPTIMFQPVFGNEQTIAVGKNELNTPRVYPIFWGSYWGDHLDLGNQIAAQLQKIAQFGGSHYDYLSGLKQYNSAGAPLIFNATFDAGSDPTGPIAPGLGDQTTQEIERVIYKEPSGVPNPDQIGKLPIYAVFTAPNVNANGLFGYNQPGFHDLFDPASVREEIWVSTGNDNGDGTFSMDHTTRVFSHELVEAMTDAFGPVPVLGGIQVNAGGSFPGNTTAGPAGNQLCDNEPNNNYEYHLGGPSGPMVEAYWSFKNKQYIVPDGNSLVMQITPASWKYGAFAGGDLTINANQAGVPQAYAGNQSIAIDTVAISGGTGVQVIMDGETFDFEPNQINSITINAANDNEAITVHGMLNSVPMKFNLGTGHYTVKLDPTQASDEILSPVTVNTLTGATLEVQLAPTGSLDFLNAPVVVNGSGPGSAVTFKIPDTMPNILDGLINPYSGQMQLPNSPLIYINFGTTYLRSYSGILGQTLGHLTLVNGGIGNGFNSEVDTVTGPGSGTISLDGGTLQYADFGEIDDLVPAKTAKYILSGKSPIDIGDGPSGPSVNYSPTTSLEQFFPSAIGGLRGGLIVPIDFANKTAVTVRAGGHNATVSLDSTNPAAGMTQMTIDPGAGATSVNIAATAAAVATTVTNSGGRGDHETVTLHSATQGVQGILGSVTLTNPKAHSGAGTTLVVDDTGDMNPQSAILNDSALYNLVPGQVSWDVISGLTIDGGSGGNTFLLGSDGQAPKTTINTGAGDDTVNVQLYSMSNFNLTLDGGTGTNQLSVVGFLPQTVIKQTSPNLITGYTKGYFGYLSHIQYANFGNVTLTPVSNLPPLPGGSGPPPKGSLAGLDNFFLFMLD